MSTQTQSEPLNPHYEECLRMHKCWVWFLCLGILLVVVGAVAISYAVLATLTTVLLFGYLLLAGGVVEVVNAFISGSWKGMFLHLLSGFLHVVLGMFMIERPERAAEILTLILAVAFLIGGVVRSAGALRVRFAGWNWVLLNGVVTFILGVLIWREWPESAYWVIGLFAGIDMIFNGWSWVMLGLMVKSAAPPAHAPEPHPPMGAAVPTA
jgi:uncharacterized membrane protein HdeD (DUF308 family)